MLPLRESLDRSEPRRPARVVWTLLALNVIAFAIEVLMVRSGYVSFATEWGFVPRVLTQVDAVHGITTIGTGMFLHAGWFHLLGNLWFLWFFGPSVEDALGHRRFAALYLASGVAAALAQALFDPAGRIPMLGASGAIGGVLAAYVSLFPMRRIVTLVPVVVVPLLLPIPALFFVIEWFVINLFRGLGALRVAQGGGVAWWAHIGGFLGGLVLVRLLFPAREEPDATPPLLEVEVRGEDGRRYETS